MAVEPIPAELRVLASRDYAGPSLHADQPAIAMRVAFRAGRDLDLSRQPGVRDFFVAALGRFAPPSLSEPGKLQATQMLAEVALALQATVSTAETWFTVLAEAQRGQFTVVFAQRDPAVGLVAGRIAASAIDLVLRRAASGVVQEPLDPAMLRQQFRKAVDVHNLGANGQHLVDELTRRGIPWRRIEPGDMTVVAGHGHRRQRLRETLFDTQPRMGGELATAKHITSSILADAGIPVPAHFLVRSEARAVAAADRLGYPVVVKPNYTDRGVSVHVNVPDAAHVRIAFADAARHGPVLVQQFIPGHDYRLTVLRGRMLAATQRLPAYVRGDGRSTLQQLIETENRNPRRSKDYVARMMQVIKIDDDLANQLALRGLTLESVPAAGVVVPLHGMANLSAGGEPIDVTARVHPDNRALVERAVRIVGLTIAGVDFLCPDITRSYRDVGGAICEVNPGPGLRVHLASPGAPDVVGPIVDHLFPQRSNGRIPTAAITGTNGKTTTSRMVASMLRQAGHCVGLATTVGVDIGGEEVARGDLAGPPGARIVFGDPTVTAAVLETARGGIIHRGLAFDSCEVSAVLNVGDDHIGLDGIETREAMAAVKGVVLKAARQLAVLNAEDPLCLSLRETGRARETCLFALDPENGALRAHVGAGRMAVTVEGQGEEASIVLYRNGARAPVIALAHVPAAFAGRAAFNVANALAAVGTGIGLGLDIDTIARGLAGFRPDHAMSRGRCTFVEGLPFRLLLDYAHNPEGIAAILDFAAGEAAGGRRTLIMSSCAGNRSDAHLIASGAAAAAGGFDTYVCTSGLPRQRKAAEVAALLARGLTGAGVAAERIRAAESEVEAVRMVAAEARPGDFVVALCADADRVLRTLAGMRGGATAAAG